MQASVTVPARWNVVSPAGSGAPVQPESVRSNVSAWVAGSTARAGAYAAVPVTWPYGQYTAPRAGGGGGGSCTYGGQSQYMSPSSTSVGSGPVTSPPGPTV